MIFAILVGILDGDLIIVLYLNYLTTIQHSLYRKIDLSSVIFESFS